MFYNFSDNEYSKEKDCSCKEIKRERCCYYPNSWCEEEKKEGEYCHEDNKYEWQKDNKNCGCSGKGRENWVEDKEYSQNYYNNNFHYEERCEHNQKQGCCNQKENRNQKRCCFCSLFNCCRW